MLSANSLETVRVTIERLGPEGLLFASRHKFMSETQFAYRLLAWDAISYYGTQVQYDRRLGTPGFILSPWHAVHFLTRLPVNKQIAIEWPDNFMRYQAMAERIQMIMESGAFMPDYSTWSETGTMHWKSIELLPEEELADWLHGAVEDFMHRHPTVHEAWAQVVHLHPEYLEESVHDARFVTEAQWLSEIGWKENPRPFHIGLQLMDEETDDTFSLTIFLQDKTREDYRVGYDPVTKDLYTLDETAEMLSDDWLAFGDEIVHAVGIWGQLAPWLVETRDGTVTHWQRQLDANEAWAFLSEVSPQLSALGYVLLLPAWWEKVQKMQGQLSAHVRSSVGARGESLFGINQTIGFDWRISVGDLAISEQEFLALSESKRRLMRFRNQWIQLDPTFIDKLRKSMEQIDAKKGLTLKDVFLWDEPEEKSAEDTGADDSRALPIKIELNDHMEKLLLQLKNTSELPLQPVPTRFQGTLRPYQQRGFSWLAFLRKLGLGAVLADDMGLGKTIQYIAYLLDIQEKRTGAERSHPSLLVCPTSVVGNWQKELERFAPDLAVHVHYGPNRVHGETFIQMAAGMDLVITTYGLSVLDATDLSSVPWASLCLDEAQTIKNFYTKQSAALRAVSADHRIALTGTPMENRLTELWSIMDFVNPGYLGRLRTFTQTYVNPIEKTNDTDLISRVQRLVRPFMLRRLKNDPRVEVELPQKSEMKTYVALTAEQAALYEGIVQGMLEKIDREEPMARRGIILATLLRLKQVCDHPSLVLKDFDEGVKPSRQSIRTVVSRSAKLSRLVEMIKEVRDEGDQALIFTQFITAGHILRQALATTFDEPVLFLHGGVPKAQRDEMIEAFQRTRSVPLLVLSLKAGGVGLNLTAASQVFHFDRWWNPAVENQATDRAYRIGQEQHVQVHKMISLGTLEERIDTMIDRKQALNESIVGQGEQWITELGRDELQELLVLRRDWVEN